MWSHTHAFLVCQAPCFCICFFACGYPSQTQRVCYKFWEGDPIVYFLPFIPALWDMPLVVWTLAGALDQEAVTFNSSSNSLFLCGLFCLIEGHKYCLRYQITGIGDVIIWGLQWSIHAALIAFLTMWVNSTCLNHSHMSVLAISRARSPTGDQRAQYSPAVNPEDMETG